jgi:ribose-phosphate pyrophosphokinase
MSMFSLHMVYYFNIGLFTGNAIEKIKKSSVSKVIVTNTIHQNTKNNSNKIVVLSTATLIAESIRRVHLNESLSDIFI